MHLTSRPAGVLAACLLFLFPLSAESPRDTGEFAPAAKAALDRITPNGLRADVSFLASDLLAGRDTPSPGLDIAAEFIAAQFRRAGLEPAGDDGYFQTAHFISVDPNPAASTLTIEFEGKSITAGEDKIAMPDPVAVDLAAAALLKANAADPATYTEWTADTVRGKVVVAEYPQFSGMGGQQRRQAYEQIGRFRQAMAKLKPALIVLVRGTAPARAATGERLREAAVQASTPTLMVQDPDFRKAVAAMKPGAVDAKLSAKIPAPVEHPVTLHNVVGLLRGSDPALKDTYVLVTSHYDHLGVAPAGDGDRIFNGANDDASGTASVIEIAAALDALPQHPRRSIVFITFFGEEKGLLGSQYYARHPVFPLAKTVADLNLEHMGRTDDMDGPRLDRAAVTGFDYSDVEAFLEKAGKLTGVTVYKDGGKSDLFFAASDNQSLADAGIPAHTISVAYIFPDYHKVGDEWSKLDYANMAKVDRMVALGLLFLGDSAEAPRWNASNPKAARYEKAYEQQHPEQHAQTQ